MSALGELLNRAMEAPEGESRVEDAEGNVATIDRDPAHPGAMRVQVWKPGARALAVEHVVVPPTDVRPEYLPSDVPFFPGLECRVVRRGELLNIGWTDSEEVERAMPGNLREELERMAGEPPATGEVSLRSVAEDLDDPAALEWVRARERPSEPSVPMVQMFEALVSAYEADGWLPEVVPTQNARVSRIVRYVGRTRSSTLVLSSLGGVDSLGVSEVPVTDPDSSGA